ncbi:MAG TPA: 16S rRNA (guanine(527)-N(7))-methyltransferase RsmG [Marinobacterium sp.]|nr:16S rRNA (guanine(527)-N(7))-methyltransferase RsmG [Marinobacterium sp.]
MDLARRLSLGLNELGIDTTPLQEQQLLAYLGLMQKWNKAYNLTAIRDPEQMLIRHLFDSLAVAPHVSPTDLIDVGSGGGLPGIPLAIIYPQLAVTTLDSNSKKTRFQNQVRIELDLTNLEVIHGRVEELENRRFSQVISRAFASISDMVTLSHELLAEKGVFLAMKGRYPDAELAVLPSQYGLQQSYELRVPGLDEERHLLVLGRA